MIDLDYTIDSGIGGTARIGLVVLASDFTVENEFRRLIPGPDIDFFSARIANSPTITPDTLADMQQRIAATTSLILPGEKLDVVAFGCTSATVVMGEEAVFQQIREVQADARCTTPITAAFSAFNAMGASRIAVLTPYRHDVNQQVQSYIENAGFTVPVFGSFNQESDPLVARIDATSVTQAIEALVKNNSVDMVFVSCTNVRFVDLVCDVESALGIPATSSNHAMAWHCLRLAGCTDKFPQWGRLFDHQLAAD